ncbi:hypothetical protein HETIRDRAFT_310228 [Heterobasidion irregulare TC 32-1]|uniref:Uncharacterized protein n=1 Tax=Heterobasidion irregulare (strain TC 32-1) TaxID=747525 RepID=W4KKC9_HETIT|nr:uncharacterized protein HETIRDRAFT_310228 [Heterobasidion irregulare TC 32-1]ETW86288.1 hypothetical protein HETIRDRAFT_310228 [Heterobasidion irregulare TC 32-1]
MRFLSPWIRFTRFPVALRLPRVKVLAASLSTLPASESLSPTPSTGAFKFVKIVRPIRVFRHFETLDQHRLRSSDFVKLDKMCPICRVQNTEQGIPLYSKRMIIIYGSRHKYQPFPPETKGFFYYWANPETPVDGQVRFRVTRDGDPSSFTTGFDLLGLDGLPWCITLFQALNMAKYSPLGELLLKENLVTKEIAEQACSLRTRLKQSAIEHLRSKRIRPVLKLGQVFSLHLASSSFTIWTDREDAASKTTRNSPWTFKAINPKTQRQCLQNAFDAGIIHVCFERSPLPSHAGKRYLALRVVKIAEPIQMKPYDQINGTRPIPPLREGELITRVSNRLWTIDCETSSKKRIAFGRLFDDEMPDEGAAAKEERSQ